MSVRLRAVGVVAVALAATAAAPVAAQAHSGSRAAGAVFVQTNDTVRNEVVAYARDGDGSLDRLAAYTTGGKGGKEVGAPVDALAGQDSLVYDAPHRLLLVVNAGSATVTSFRVDGASLRRLGTVPSGGDFPVSITVRGSSAYVLNAGGAGTVAGFAVTGRGLWPLPGSSRSLGLSNDPTPGFLTAPGQVAFTPDGARLVVTTKGNGTLLTLRVGFLGHLSAPVVTASPGVPFAVSFDARGTLAVAEAGTNAVSTYRVRHDGTLAPITVSLPSGGAAVCWITTAGRYHFVSNTGSSTISSYRANVDGTVTLTGPPVATVSGGAGAPIDLAVTGDDRYLYAQDALNGVVQGFRIGAGGTLTLVETVDDLEPYDADGGMEGIVAI